MLKNLVTSIFILASIVAFSQTGVNTTTPQAMLHVEPSSSTAPISTDGIIIPRVSAFPSNPTADQNAMIIYLTAVSGTNQPGFYYWSSTGPTTGNWLPLGQVGWSLTGNAETSPGVNFIGTTDASDVIFKRDDDFSGLLAFENTSFGRNSLKSYLESGSNKLLGGDNSAFGTEALANNTTGAENCAYGDTAMNQNKTGSRNTIMGSEALNRSDNTINNVGVGFQALRSCLGSSNVAIGYDAMDTTGNYSLNTTSLGTAHERNVAVGSESMNDVIGSRNVAVGYGSLKTYQNAPPAVVFSNAVCNTAIGYDSLRNCTGSNNIAIGCNANVPNLSGSNQVRIGNSSITYAAVQVAWTITSDMRAKSNIKQSPLGLQFLKALNPVSYYRNNDYDKNTEYGFLAQEVEATMKKYGDFSAGVVHKDDNGNYSMRYNDLISIIVKAVQEQDNVVKEQKDRLDELEARLKKLEELLIKK